MPEGSYNSLDSESEMLPQDPPPFVVRATSRLLIILFALAGLGAVAVRLPESVEVPFVLIPQEGADPIQSPRLALISKVAVIEGQTIKAGSDMFVLRSDEIGGWTTDLRLAEADLKSSMGSLERSDIAYQSQIKIKEAEIQQAQSEVEFREKHTSSSRDLLERMEKLSKTGGISQVELIQLRLELAESEKDLSVAQRTVQQVQLDQKKLETEYARDRGEALAEIEKLKVKVGALKEDLLDADKSLLSIRAPYDAVVISVAQRSVGNVVQAGQELCQLARKEAKPKARLLLSEAGLSKLKPGQKTKLFLEAYPYQRYGAVTAVLDWISPSAVATSEGNHFVALASIDQDEKTAKQIGMRVGMRGQARVMVGKKTMVESVLLPIKELQENLKG